MPAKLLADENIPARMIDALRAEGFDVLSIQETTPGISDANVLRLAVDQARILLTFDRDYGELIFRQGFAPPISVIYFRSFPSNPYEVSDTVISLLRESESLAGAILVITRQGIRRRNFQKKSNE